MKIALAQINTHIGNFDFNFSKIAENITTAEQQGADIIVFPELAVCGYPPRDFLDFDDFIDKCYAVIEQIKSLTENIAVIVGSPSRNPQIEGKDLFNSAFFIYQNKVQDVIHKALLPTYDIFDEYRHFEPNTEFHCITFQGKKIALTICEDLWNVGNENPMYRSCPMDILTHEKPDVMINISASPFDYLHAQGRLDVLRENVQRYKVPLFYVNHSGAQTDLIFDGGSVVMNVQGKVFSEMIFFKEAMQVFDLEKVIASGIDLKENLQTKEKIPMIYEALVTGVRNYFEKLNFNKAIFGLSGGMDSALVAVIAAEALGNENVKGVLMPSPYSSKHSVDDALQLAKNLKIAYEIIPIHNMYDTFLKELTPSFLGKPFDVTEENLQARIRGMILMALSNKHGYILLNTTNKSEAAVGYGTLYGDLCGGLAVLADVYKTEVYAIANYINRTKEIIPFNIIHKAPSAELKHDQTDQDTLPPYEVLDNILFQYIEKSKSPDDIIAMGFDASIVKRTLKMVNSSEWKRYQFAPVLRVSPKAFGMGRRMPIEGKYLS
ncbi:MAG: NAD+ synthase [Chitinophagales bacterium]|nr:NAD+ synthase [Bacteroidota bacterium]